MVTSVFVHAGAYFYTLGLQKRVCAALVAQIGVCGAIDHAAEFLLNDSIGTGPGAAHAGTGLQGNIDGSTW